VACCSEGQEGNEGRGRIREGEMERQEQDVCAIEGKNRRRGRRSLRPQSVFVVAEGAFLRASSSTYISFLRSAPLHLNGIHERRAIKLRDCFSERSSPPVSARIGRLHLVMHG